MEETKLGVPHAIIIAGFVIAAAVLLSGNAFGLTEKKLLGNAQTGSVAGSRGPISVAAVTGNDHIAGNPKAEIAVIEFSDLECPFCKMFHPTLKRLVDEKGNEVMWVYRHFPIETLHKKARKEAEASECAAEQGGNAAFWNYIGKIFEITPANDGLDPAELPKIAKDLGLDVAKFNACLERGVYGDVVNAHLTDGQRAGVTGTPASVIVNVRTGATTLLVGAESYENLLNAIERVK